MLSSHLTLEPLTFPPLRFHEMVHVGDTIYVSIAGCVNDGGRDSVCGPHIPHTLSSIPSIHPLG